jgi:hypothetical protein
MPWLCRVKHSTTQSFKHHEGRGDCEHRLECADMAFAQGLNVAMGT